MVLFIFLSMYLFFVYFFNTVFLSVDFVLGFSFFFVLYFVMQIGWNMVDEMWADNYRKYNDHMANISLAYHNLGLVEIYLYHNFVEFLNYLIYWFVHSLTSLEESLRQVLRLNFASVHGFNIENNLKFKLKNIQPEYNGFNIKVLSDNTLIYLSKFI